MNATINAAGCCPGGVVGGLECMWLVCVPVCGCVCWPGFWFVMSVGCLEQQLLCMSRMLCVVCVGMRVPVGKARVDAMVVWCLCVFFVVFENCIVDASIFLYFL